MSVPQIRTLVSAVVDMLATATDLVVGDSQVPSDTGIPYLIVYALPFGEPTPTLADPEALVDMLLQVTAVGLRRDQADGALDRARLAILGRQASGVFTHAIAATGFTVCGRSLAGHDPGSTDLSLGVANAHDRYSFLVTWP